MENIESEKKNSNRKIIFISSIAAVVSLIMFLTLSNAYAASYADSQLIRATVINQEPDPVDAGNYVTVKFRIENIGLEQAKDVVFELVSNFPFSLDPGINASRNIGTLDGVQVAADAPVIEYKIKVDENALSGANDLKLRYKSGTSGWVELPPFTLRVRRYFMGLSIVSINTSDNYFAPGKETEVTIALKNLADSSMRDVSVSISLSGSTPFAPIGSGTEKRVYSIIPGETKTFNFRILSSPETVMGIYKIPITIIYKDESNSNHTISDVLGIVVNARPELSVRLDSSAIKSAGTSGKIVLKIVNSGLGDVKFLNLQVSDTDRIQVISGKDQYIGQLSSDDYDTADITMYIARGDSGIVGIPVTLRYSDSMGNLYEQNESVEIKLYSAAEQRKMGLTAGGSPIGIILIVAIALAAFFIYKRRKRHSAKKL